MSTLVHLTTPAPGIAMVTMDNEPTLNGLSIPMVNQLRVAFETIVHNEDCRLVILTGAGRAFCSGGDLAEVRRISPSESGVTRALFNAQNVGGLISQMVRLPQPIIAAVNGPAAGGGLALALASDIRICTPTAKFNAAFVRIGLSGCEMGVSYTLPRVVGMTAAFEMMLTGRMVEAEEALRLGLVSAVVPDAVAAALDMAQLVLRNSPLGIRMTKEVMWANLDASSIEQAMALESRSQAICARMGDFTEALDAFLERRPPTFRNE